MKPQVVRSLIKPSEYHDSVSLMLAARELSCVPGVQDASVVMGTEANKSILKAAGLLTGEASTAGVNDLIIAISAETDEAAEAALRTVDALLKKKSPPGSSNEFQPKSIRGATSLHPETNVAVISVAGRYATNEAWEALTRGLHVLLFSDNVSLEDEIALKTYARDHGLLLMGPGAGTTILNGAALGFANVLPRGSVGIVSAAGTGLQEVSTLLARRGIGISQGIGTGGRDLKKEVGGIMMLAALSALQQDTDTAVIVLVSKPPAPEVAEAILHQVAANSKPTVVCFFGGGIEYTKKIQQVIFARTLYECALQAVRLIMPESKDVATTLKKENTQLAKIATAQKRKLKPEQRYLRGLFSGGTLCYEAQVILKEMLDSPVYSNAPLPGVPALIDSTKSQGHTAVDLGEEEFTVGRPHPMIDNDLRIRRLMQEARDPETAVILLDVVIGYGAHPDPAAELGKAAQAAQHSARETKHELVFVASVTGTESDPQCLSRTTTILEQAGFIICQSNAAAARLAGEIVTGRRGFK